MLEGLKENLPLPSNTSNPPQTRISTFLNRGCKPKVKENKTVVCVIFIYYFNES